MRQLDNGRIPAMTLTETLVVMIVAGIVFLSVMDGLGLMRRHTAAVGDRITANSRFYDGYYRLEDIVTGADSITRSDGGALCWRGGREVTIAMLDSALIAGYGSVTDTLMHNVETLHTTHRPDSLVVVLQREGGSITVSFPATPPLQITAQQSIAEREKEHEYE